MKKYLLLFFLLSTLRGVWAQGVLHEIQIYRKANNTIATTFYMYIPEAQCTIEGLFALSDQNESFRAVSKPIAKLPDGKAADVAEGLFDSDGNLVVLTNEKYTLLTYFGSTPTTLCRKCEGWSNAWAMAPQVQAQNGSGTASGKSQTATKTQLQ